MSERTKIQSPQISTPPVFTPTHGLLLQRKCDCGGAETISGNCEQCSTDRLNLQRYSASRPNLFSEAVSSQQGSTSSGVASDQSSSHGHQLGRLRVHRKPAATNEAEATERYEREADDIATQVVSALGGGDSQRSEATAMLSAAQPMIQRQVADESLESEDASASESETAAPKAAATLGLIVEDDAEQIGPDQMRRSDFLSELQAAVCAAADEELANSGNSTEGCPYVDFWFGYYRTRDSRQIERAIHKYAPEAETATSARDYIPIITDRIRRAVAVWATTGEVTGVPEGVSAGASASAGAESSGTGSTASTEGEPEVVLAKSRKGGITGATDPRHIRAQLGAGRPIESGVRSRMESAFGHDFSSVRIHTDAGAAHLSSDLNARAFTIGHNVAFGHNEYKPGTIVGDAIMAHELAHVVQQGGATAAPAPKRNGTAAYESLERDADQSALGAVVSLWSDAKGKLADLAKNAMPRLQTGLTLSRCDGCEGGCNRRETPTPVPTPTPTPKPTPLPAGIKGVTNADGKGWLTVKHADGSFAPPLPQYMKVKVTSTAGGRENFTIMESGFDGKYIGKAASVKLKPDGTSYLDSTLTYKSAASVTFDIAKEEVTYGGSGPVYAITQTSNPTPSGTHDLEIPDEPHPGGGSYEDKSIFAKTWFRIGHSGDRYLHPGMGTLGCTTVKAVDKWTDMYNYLINSRKDDKNVGTITVT